MMIQNEPGKMLVIKTELSNLQELKKLSIKDLQIPTEPAENVPRNPEDEFPPDVLPC